MMLLLRALLGWSAGHRVAFALRLVLRVEFLAQVQEAGQPYAGFAGLVGRTVRWRDFPARGEQLLDREGGLVIGGRDLHHGQTRPCHVRVIDLPRAWHYATASLTVLRSGGLRPTEKGTLSQFREFLSAGRGGLHQSLSAAHRASSSARCRVP